MTVRAFALGALATCLFSALPAIAGKGVTTIVINQDGFGSAPLEEVFRRSPRRPQPSISPRFQAIIISVAAS